MNLWKIQKPLHTNISQEGNMQNATQLSYAFSLSLSFSQQLLPHASSLFSIPSHETHFILISPWRCFFFLFYLLPLQSKPIVTLCELLHYSFSFFNSLFRSHIIHWSEKLMQKTFYYLTEALKNSQVH